MKALTLLALPAAALLACCASTSPTPDADRYVGQWRSADGVFVNCFRREDDVYVLRSNRSGVDRVTEGDLIDVEGTTMLRVKVYDPPAEDAARGMVPLYHFGVLSVKDGRLQHTPIRADWLARAMRDHDAGQYVGTAQAVPATGVGITPDWSAMEHILRDAVTEQGALGATESFDRVQGP